MRSSLVLGDDISEVDVQHSVSASSYASRQALAEFLCGLGPQYGHWYSIILANSISGIDKRVARAFPSPSKKVAAIAKREAHMQARLGFSYFINEAGKRTKSDVLRKVLGSWSCGPSSEV